MAKSINKATLFLNLVLMLSLLLTINMAESKQLLGIGFGKGKSAPVCNQVFAQRDGDTCFSISKMFNLTPEFFSAINPNLNCDKIFIGEWLCVDGASLSSLSEIAKPPNADFKPDVIQLAVHSPLLQWHHPGVIQLEPSSDGVLQHPVRSPFSDNVSLVVSPSSFTFNVGMNECSGFGNAKSTPVRCISVFAQRDGDNSLPSLKCSI